MDALDETAREIVRGFMNDVRVMRHTPSPVHLLAVSLAHLQQTDPTLGEELSVSALGVLRWTAQNLPIAPRYLPPMEMPAGDHVFIAESDEDRDQWKAAAEMVVAIVNDTLESLDEDASLSSLLRAVLLATLDDVDVQSCLVELDGNVDLWRARLGAV